jgi:putative transposase
MVGNHHLARAITDASWGEFSRQLAYKAEWYGCELVVAPRFFASSKTCSKCGIKRDELSLAVRVFSCGQCGLVADRDTNAAANLAAWGECELGARETRLRTPKCGAGTPMPAEDRALAITSRDGETQSATPAPVGQKREPVRTDSSA